jgi:hypothetical protein
LLCIIDIAEEVTKKKIDIIKAIQVVINKEWVIFNKQNMSDSDNFYVRFPDKILEHFTGKKWEVTKEPGYYKVKDNEYAVEFWSVDGKNGHFARLYKGFNSLQKSNSVNNGKIISYRIFREVK